MKGEKKMIRVIYMAEEYSNDGELVYRGFARNKKTAKKLAKRCEDPIVRKLQKAEMPWVSVNDIEG